VAIPWLASFGYHLGEHVFRASADSQRTGKGKGRLPD